MLSLNLRVLLWIKNVLCDIIDGVLVQNWLWGKYINALCVHKYTLQYLHAIFFSVSTMFRILKLLALPKTKTNPPKLVTKRMFFQCNSPTHALIYRHRASVYCGMLYSFLILNKLSQSSQLYYNIYFTLCNCYEYSWRVVDKYCASCYRYIKCDVLHVIDISNVMCFML